ncbi:Conserved_hypothetical protein [Hexamita inflata]|uniref:Folliculin/SMCR8 longin domain-containing protein n=1 Tax=Hexamita inflata TaxID=28002 RepID=A0AA86NZ68_9EUKA|nr:Conserved hypothetical protein [Hexamita inflata]
MTDNSDILICAEFKQILGPSIIFTVPQQPRIQTKSVKETEDVLNALTLKAMSMKFTFDDSQKSEQTSPYNDDSYIVMEFDELKRYTCMWYFTYLPDLSARGFSRRIGIAYICPFKEKLMRHMDCLSYAFQQALLCLKYPLCAVYRYESVEYAAILDNSIQKVKDKLSCLDVDDDMKAELVKQTSNYTVEGVQLLLQQIIDLKYFILNKHALIHMKHVPLFFMLFQTEEITDLINYTEFATFQFDVNYLKKEKKILPKLHIIPENFKSLVTIPPHELRIQKRQELRTLDQIATPGFFNYFRTLLTLIFNYFSQSIADLEFSEIMTQYNTQALVQSKKLKGIWFGQKFFLPCELDEAFALSYTFQPYKRYRDLYIPVESFKLKDQIMDENNYQILDFNGEPVLSINMPYQQITDKFYIAYHSMFPYLPALQPSPSNLTQAMPSYGHLFYYFKEIFNDKLVKTLVTQLLAGYQVLIMTDEKAFGILMQQILDPFIIGQNYQQNRSIMDQFSEGLLEKHIIHQLTILHYTHKQSGIKVFADQIMKSQMTFVDFQFKAKIVTFNGQHQTCTIAEDLLLQKETPTVFCISRRLECCFRKYVLESLYNDKLKKTYKTGEDQRIAERIKQIVDDKEALVFVIGQKKKNDTYKLTDGFQESLNKSGIHIMVLQELQKEEQQVEESVSSLIPESQLLKK